MRMQGYGLVMPAPQMGAFGGAWEDWCDQHYWTTENNAKCKNCPTKDPIFGKCLSFDPKTMAGRATRGLPQQTDLERLGPATPEQIPSPTPYPESGGGESWFDKNKMLVFAGGGVVVLGLIAFAMKGGGRRMNGFAGMLGFRHKKRRSRKAKR